MHKYLIPSIVLVLGLLSSQAALAAGMSADLTKYGYPDVLAAVNFQPGQAATITVADQEASGMVRGYMTIKIPADAFAVPVKFEVLAGKNSDWNGSVPSSLSVVANFAYRVTDLKTGALIDKFDHPVTYSVTDSMITKNSVYWATTATSPVKLINANASSKIMGNTLDHLTPVASVGWIITTPKADLAGKM